MGLKSVDKDRQTANEYTAGMTQVVIPAQFNWSAAGRVGGACLSYTGTHVLCAAKHAGVETRRPSNILLNRGFFLGYGTVLFHI